jgi:hypothetical protein
MPAGGWLQSYQTSPGAGWQHRGPVPTNKKIFPINQEFGKWKNPAPK